MKRLLLVIGLTLGLALVVSAKPVEIKFASVAPEGSTWMNLMEELNEEVKTATKGEVSFKFFPGGVHGDEKDVLRKMKINQLQAAGFTSQGLGEVVTETRLLNLPLLFENYSQVDYVMAKLAPVIEKKFEQKGFVVLGWPEVGFVYVYTKNKVESIADFQKTKMWIWGDDVLVNTLFKNLGIVPIPLSLVDVMQSLQTGLIEGVYCSPLSAIALQWNTRVKYMLDVKIANVPGGILINKKTWLSIPEKHRAVVAKLAKKYCDKITAASRKENEESLGVLKKQGIAFTAITTEADKKFLAEASVKTANELVGKFYDKKILDEMMKYLSEAKSGAKK